MPRTKPPHEPTAENRRLVQLHTTVGTTQEDIARILGIDPKTLRKHYREELDLSRAKANATIGGALFNKAKDGDTAAMIFWMKTQAGWREKQTHEHSGPDGMPMQMEDVTRRDANAFTSHLSRLAAARPEGGNDGEPEPGSES